MATTTIHNIDDNNAVVVAVAAATATAPTNKAVCYLSFSHSLCTSACYTKETIYTMKRAAHN